MKSTMKRVILWVCLCLSSALISAQQGDERAVLLQRLKHSDPDTSRISIMLDLCRGYLGKNSDSAFYWAEQARDLSNEIDEAERAAYSTLHMGRAFGYAGEVEEAKKYYREAATLYDALGMRNEASSMLHETAVEYIFSNQYDSAVVYMHESLPIFEELRDTARLSKLYNNLAIVYGRMAFYDEARTYYRKSYEVRKAQGDRAGMATILLNIGVLHFRQDAYDSSLAMLDEALKLAVTEEQTDVMALALMNKAANFQRLRRYEESLAPAHDALALMLKIGDVHNPRLVHSTLGNAHGNLGNCDSAMYYISLGEEGGLPADFRQVRLNYRTKALCAGESGNYKDALKYKELEMNYRDSVLMETQRETVASMQVKYEQEVRKKDLLAKEKQVAEARADQSEAEASRSRALNIAAFIGILALILAFVAVFIYMRNRRRQELMQIEVEQHMDEIQLLQSRVAELAEAPQPAREPRLSPEEVNQYLLSPLTARELEVLKLISEGNSNQQIADLTFVSINTIKTHVNHIYEKLDVKNRTQATMKASELNLLQSEEA